MRDTQKILAWVQSLPEQPAGCQIVLSPVLANKCKAYQLAGPLVFIDMILAPSRRLG